jgi:hypothetical protein
MNARQPTGRSPPTIRAEITNTQDEPHSLTTPLWTFPLNPLVPDTGDWSIVVLDTSEFADHIPDRISNDCWRANGKLIFRPSTNGKSFMPGESLTREYAVLNASKNQPQQATAGCWPTGRYQFSQQYWLDSPRVGGSGGRPVSWQFELRLTADPAVRIISTDVDFVE